MILLSPHFTLSEFLKSKTAAALKIDNSRPTWLQIECMEKLCANVLEPLRALLRLKFHPNAVVVITSGYRCPALNLKVGGAVSGGHPKGQAADIHIEDGEGNEIMTAQQLFEFILTSGLPFDQAIQEYGEWVHVSHRRLNRRQSMYAWHDAKGRVRYTTRQPSVFAVQRMPAPLT